MDFIRAFMPNVKAVGKSPFPEVRSEADQPFSPSLYGGFSRFSQCCRRAMNRTIIAFCDPTLFQCRDELNDYLSAWSGNKTSLEKVDAEVRELYDPTALPWVSKPQYLNSLRQAGRLRESRPPEDNLL